jgi:Zn-dependent peptidase ImmA (M78 family)
MVHEMEIHGVRVFSLALDAKEVDAFSLWSGGVPFVLLNTMKSGERSRFDAAHELGHLVMHPHGGPSSSREAESQADAFASAFLMPEGSIRANAPRFATADEIVRLRAIWGTSATAVAYRMHRLKILSDWHYHRIIVELSGRGFRRQEHNGIPRESSALLPKLLSNLYEQDGLTRSAIARELALPKSEIDQMLFGLTLSGIPGRRRGNPQLTDRSALGPQLVN